MTQTKGPSRQLKIIAAGAVAIVGLIGLTAVLLNNANNDEGETVEYGDVTVIGEALPVYDADTQDPATGMDAPEIEGFSVDSEPIEIIPNGHPKMIVFLAHWCEHCQAEVPRVQEWLDEGNLPEDIEVWSIATSTDEGQPNYPPSAWLRREGWTPELMMDNQRNSAANAYGLSGFPFWVIVDRDGKVVARNAGQTDIAQVEAWALEITETS
ncbi:MAG: TlpA family protein disulfide reductase [Acidimicrobiales bacterium]